MTWIIIGTILISVAIMVSSFITEKYKNDAVISIIFLLGYVMLLYGEACVTSEPTPLDVYRGKTQLNVTSVNGVPVDSVVVFK